MYEAQWCIEVLTVLAHGIYVQLSRNANECDQRYRLGTRLDKRVQ